MKYFLLLLVTFITFSCSDSEPETPNEQTYKINGLIAGDSQQNMEVTLTDESLSSTTINTENLYIYTFEGLNPGVYTIRPGKVGLVFSPETLQITITDADVLDADFTATLTAPVSIQNIGFEYFNESVFDALENENDQLRLNLTENAIWYQNREAGLVYTEMTGDFTFSAKVSAQKASNHDQAPDCDVCLGGLMVRNEDDSNGENYVHIVVGRNPAGIGVETKNTTNGNSEYTPTNDESAVYEIQIERNETTFVLSKRAVGETEWQLAAQYERPDLPTTIQLGFNIYTSENGTNVADLSVLFEDIVIEYVSIL